MPNKETSGAPDKRIYYIQDRVKENAPVIKMYLSYERAKDMRNGFTYCNLFFDRWQGKDVILIDLTKEQENA